LLTLGLKIIKIQKLIGRRFGTAIFPPNTTLIFLTLFDLEEMMLLVSATH
jgi:hypothetical protein